MEIGSRVFASAAALDHLNVRECFGATPSLELEFRTELQDAWRTGACDLTIVA